MSYQTGLAVDIQERQITTSCRYSNLPELVLIRTCSRNSSAMRPLAAMQEVLSYMDDTDFLYRHSFDILGLIPFKWADRVGNMPLTIPAHIQIQHRPSIQPQYLSKAPLHILQRETESTSSDNLCGVLR